jgi:hypothetical protein
MTYEMMMPCITAASITPNPVSASNTYIISIAITEKLVALEAEIRYSGTFYAGEEG